MRKFLRSKEYPVSPETRPAKDDEGFRTKFLGCMAGGLIGDCLGAPFERLPRRTRLDLSKLSQFLKMIMTAVQCSLFMGSQFQVDKNYKNGGYYKYTDDTAMARALATSLILSHGFDPVHVAKAFAQEFFSNAERKRQYGPRVRYLFPKLENATYETVFTHAQRTYSGEGSYGNGAAMRVAPVALFYYGAPEDLCVQVARDQARITHANALGFDAAVLVCSAIRICLSLDPREPLDIPNFIDQLDLSLENAKCKDIYRSRLRLFRIIFKNETVLRNYTPKKVGLTFGNSIHAHRSVPTALFAFLRSCTPVMEYETDNGFERTVYFAIAVGGDTDTIATIACSIAGAYYGLSAIPQQMIDYCEKGQETLNLATRLLEASTKFCFSGGE